jgi:hypothetical protein
MGSLQHRRCRLPKEQSGPGPGADAYDDQIVLPDSQLLQDGLLRVGVHADGGSQRHAESVAKLDGVAQDRFFVANRRLAN